MSEAETSKEVRNRLVEVVLDPESLGRVNDNIEHEREVAIFDLIDGNSFEVEGIDKGPYKLTLSVVDDRLEFMVEPHSVIGDGGEKTVHQLSLASLKRVMKDYFLVCDSYYNAVRTAPTAKIQAIDSSRRAVHDEGSKVLRERLKPVFIVEEETARRLFTVVCSLHWKGAT